MRHLTIALLLSVVALGCATKRYGRMQELTDAERAYLSCEQLDIEIAKTRSFMDEINKDGFDGRDVLGVLGDFGIGNAMERSEALESAQRRLDQLHEQKREKGCPDALPTLPTPSEQAGEPGGSGSDE